MCGRFTRNYTWAQNHAMYSLVSLASNLQPRFNICPTTNVDVVIRGDDQRALVPMRWGLIPGWWKKPLTEMRLATFNARAETVAEKPMFRDSFKRRRCLMPASGYYEWKTTPEGKQPYYFTRRDGAVMTIAAIQDAWVDSATGEPVRSCSMLITEPNKFAAEVHDRMPVILEPKDFEQWERGDVKDAAALMFVPIKTKEQQTALMLHRTRQLLVRQRTMLSNALRGHLAKLGIVSAKGRNGTGELLRIISDGADSRPDDDRC